MKRFLMATALTCLLSVVVLAGDVPTLMALPPPPSEPQARPRQARYLLTARPGQFRALR